MTLTTFLATWGALLSTALGVWTLYRDLTDRGKLDVNCYLGRFFIEGVLDEHQDKSLHFIYRVTNIGRRPIMVETLGGNYKKIEKCFKIMNCREKRVINLTIFSKKTNFT